MTSSHSGTSSNVKSGYYIYSISLVFNHKSGVYKFIVPSFLSEDRARYNIQKFYSAIFEVLDNDNTDYSAMGISSTDYDTILANSTQSRVELLNDLLMSSIKIGVLRDT